MANKPFDELVSRSGFHWENIARVRDASNEALNTLRSIALFPETSPGDPNVDVQLVVNGSLARGEYTEDSDVDWHLLVDGPADPQHQKVAQRIGRLIAAHFNKPNPTGAFGKLTSSHELIHRIGGSRDTNENLTLRILLLLESFAPLATTADGVLARVTRQVLRRYIDLDPSVSRLNATTPVVPRFLLNDVVRYWRTMAVDYAAKKWEQSGNWALRNAKLRMSRKLIFTKGLLMCLKCERLEEQGTPKEMDACVIQHCEYYAGLSAINVMSQHLLDLNRMDLARRIFDAYNGFLGVIGDSAKREHLEELSFDKCENDDVFNCVRDLSKDFQAGLNELFFNEENKLAGLTKEYGVF